MHVNLNSKKLVLGVTTYNRLGYLKAFINSWEQTRNQQYNWTLIITDDGSTDGTIGFLKNFKPNGYQLIVNQWSRKGVHIGTNGIFRQALNERFDFGFKADDDIFFTKPGWDDLYIAAVEKSNYQHLCYFNKGWKKARFNYQKELLSAQTDVENAMGCFWTFTPLMLEKIGWFDVESFGKCGYEHVDYSMRACRKNFNDAKKFYDAATSNEFISMQGLDDKKNYLRTLNEEEQASYWSRKYRKKSLAIIQKKDRGYIAENDENSEMTSFCVNC